MTHVPSLDLTDCEYFRRELVGMQVVRGLPDEGDHGDKTLAFPGGVKFEANGRRANAPLVIVQWQNGVPLSVYPTDRALAKPRWPKQ